MAPAGRASAAPLSLLALVAYCAALLAAPASAGSQGFLPRRALLQTCLTCSGLTTCIKATCLYTDGTVNYVSVNLTSCKGASISWFCCQQNSCTTTVCDSTQVNGATCNNVLTSVVTTAVGATSVMLQVHDGRLIGDYDCGAPGNSCCGGDGGACGSGSNVCDDVVVPIAGVDTQFRNADLSSTAELPLTVDPGFGGAVFWNSRQVGGAWGGWFRITAPGSGSLTLGICGGCGQNVVGKGYYFGNGFSITFNSFTTGMSTIQINALPSSSAIASVSNLQVYLSFIAPPTLSPGSFKTFTDISLAVSPTNPLTFFPTAPFTANTKPGVTYKASPAATSPNAPPPKSSPSNPTGCVGSSTFTVPTAITASGLYLAVHLDVDTYCPSGYQWGRR
eukprot:XP_001702556.1 predicted protein [Chlamydomonas reinhardtii]